MILVALTIAGLFALYYPQPQCVSRYLWAKVVGNLILFAVDWLWNDTSKVFLWFYAAVTAMILYMVARIVIAALGTMENHWKAVGAVTVLSVTLARLSFVGLGHPAGVKEIVSILEGVALFASALFIGVLAPRLERTGLAFTLAGCWLAQSFCRIGFYVHFTSALARRLDWRVFPAIGITGFLLIGMIARRRFMGYVRKAV